MDMNIYSQETLRKVEENDAGLTKLFICNASRDDVFISTNGDHFSRLGAAIRGNTNLQCLVVDLEDADALDVTNKIFYDGIKLNSSIHELSLHCHNLTVAGGVGQNILDASQENKNLTYLSITLADLQNGGEQLISQTLRRCTNLKQLILFRCNFTTEQLMPMIDAIRGLRSLEILDLQSNRIGNAGCEIIATLLDQPSCNIQQLSLIDNHIDNEGAVTLANGLANNAKLRELYLQNNPIDRSNVVDIFNELLCNKSSINDTYLSNHALHKLVVYPPLRGDELDSLLKMNKCTTKSHVAIKKILKYHPNIDIEPLFEWNMEGEGERDLKALPYIIAWFEKAGEAVANDEEGGSYKIDERKLSAMYQCAKAMPLLFVSAS